MAINGYSGSGDKLKPDPNWWMEEIQKGEDWRKKVATEEKWPIWRDYYRGDWDKDIMPVNLFFTMVNIIIPRVYFRNPTVSISPAKPGLDHMAFARILERVDNKLIKQMKVKKYLKKTIRDGFMFGMGIPKMGFGGFYSLALDDLSNAIPVSKSGDNIEYFDFTFPNMPWISRVRPGNIVFPAYLEDTSHARWIAEKQYRSAEDLRDDPRLENTKDLVGGVSNRTSFAAIGDEREDLVEYYEVHDRKTGMVFVVTPHGSTKDIRDGRILFHGPDMMQLLGRFPYFPIVFNEDDEVAWGIPDSKILEPYQLEINENRTQIMWHRRMTIIKILVEQGAMSEAEATKMISSDVSPIIFTKKSPKRSVELMQASTIPAELFATMEQTMGDVRETVGFGRNQMGEFNSQTSDTTATEAAIVERAANIRVDERRDLMADTLTDIIEHMHSVIFSQWKQEQVIDLVGPGGIPVWVKFSGDLLRSGRYNIAVDPDSNLPESRELREARAIQLYGILKTNPILDPIKLTQFLLHEVRGPQFDDLMKQLPATGQQPNGPIAPDQFGQLVQQSISQIPQAG